MLGSAAVTVLLGTTKPEIAKAFFKDVLGLGFVVDDGFALVFESKNARIRGSRVPAVVPAQYAVLAFNVGISSNLRIKAIKTLSPLI